MTELTLILGYGPVGRGAAERLRAQGRRIVVAQRSRPADLPADVPFTPCDVLDAASVRAAFEGCDQAVVSIGLPYDGKTWRAAWPRAMRNLVAAAEASGARVVFLDNLYMYGPQRAPLREDMPLSGHGLKPAARAEATRIWMEAAAAGRITFTALRAPDFYGPGVTLSHLGEQAIGPMARGKAATLLAPPDIAHAFAYVPDIARAIVTLLDAPDDAFGQAWHMPCAPALTPREMLQIAADALGQTLRITALPLPLLPVLGLAMPFAREVHEMRFQWDRPYEVDARRFEARFWSDVTPLAVGLRDTALDFRRRLTPASAPAAQKGEGAHKGAADLRLA